MWRRLRRQMAASVVDVFGYGLMGLMFVGSLLFMEAFIVLLVNACNGE